MIILLKHEHNDIFARFFFGTKPTSNGAKRLKTYVLSRIVRQFAIFLNSIAKKPLFLSPKSSSFFLLRPLFHFWSSLVLSHPSTSTSFTHLFLPPRMFVRKRSCTFLGVYPYACSCLNMYICWYCSLLSDNVFMIFVLYVFLFMLKLLCVQMNKCHPY